MSRESGKNKRTRALKTALSSTALSIAMLATPSAYAQLDEITVTARKKEESLQRVPVAVSVLGKTQLEDAGIETFDQILDFVPNANMGGGIGGTLQGQLGIRGISTLVRIVGVETGVGLYVDGVFTGRPETFNQELIDIDRIEILRGPQGALFGKNTIAGAINIVTITPGDEPQTELELQYGNYDLTRIRGFTSGPLVDGKLYGKLSAGYVSRDGFYEHLSGGKDLETLEMSSFRGQLRFTPSDNLEFILSGDALIDRGEPVFLQPRDIAFISSPVESSTFVTDNNRPNYLDRDIWGLSLAANHTSTAGTLTSITSYRESSFDAQLDDDKTQFDFFIDLFSDDVKTFTEEVRFAGTIGDQIEYIVGAYYFNQEAESFRPFAVGDFLTGVPGFFAPITQTSAVDTESYAFFFSGDFQATDRLRLTLGGRYTREEKDAVYLQQDPIAGIFPNINFVGSSSDDAFSPTVAISYDVADETTVYARFARGFKGAGFNTDFAPSVTGLTVDPEFASSYEVGLKSDFFENRLRTNFAAFYTDYEDLQVSQVIGTAVLLSNAAQAEIYGVEAEIFATPNEYIEFNYSLGYLSPEYDDFPGCPPSAGSAAPNCAGNQLTLAPEWTSAAGVQFTHPIDNVGTFIARADWNYQSKVYFDAQNTDRLSGDERHLINLRAGVEGERWEIFAWVENVTDEEYVTFADDRSAIAVPLTHAYGAPRTFGMTLRLKL